MNLQVNGKAPEPYEKIEPYKKSPMMLINEISRIMGDKIARKASTTPYRRSPGAHFSSSFQRGTAERSSTSLRQHTSKRRQSA